MYKVKLKCPDCEIPVMDKQVNIEKALVQCDQCDGVFGLEEEDGYFNRNKPYIVIPRGVEAYHTLTTMEIDIRWRRSSKLGAMTFVTLVWNFVVSIIVVSVINTGDYWMLLSSAIHILVGVGLAYWTIANFINHTSIFIQEGLIDIEHGPLRIPFRKRNRIEASDLEQLYVECYVIATSNKSPVYAYQVIVKMKSGDSIFLIKGLKTLEHAQYIEQEIEHFLKIKDNAVKEEYLG